MSRDRPVERCPECGNVLKMEYVGPMDDPHAHGGHGEERMYYPLPFSYNGNGGLTDFPVFSGGL